MKCFPGGHSFVRAQAEKDVSNMSNRSNMSEMEEDARRILIFVLATAASMATNFLSVSGSRSKQAVATKQFSFAHGSQCCM